MRSASSWVRDQTDDVAGVERAERPHRPELAADGRREPLDRAVELVHELGHEIARIDRAAASEAARAPFSSSRKPAIGRYAYLVPPLWRSTKRSSGPALRTTRSRSARASAGVGVPAASPGKTRARFRPSTARGEQRVPA